MKRKIGSAVLRNRIKRRLRAAFQLLDPSRLQIKGDVSYIVVVRHSDIAHLPFLDVFTHLKNVLKFYSHEKTIFQSACGEKNDIPFP